MKVNEFLSCLLVFFMLSSTISCEKNGDLTPSSTEGTSISFKVVNDFVKDVPVVVAGSQSKEFIVSFNRTLPDGTVLEFESAAKLPVVLKDNEGNMWNMFGECTEGIRKGTFLQPANASPGYWFVFGAMFPGTKIFEESIPEQVFEVPLPDDPEWLVPTETITTGAGFDVIRSVDYPDFVTYDFKEPERQFYFGDEDIIIGIKIGEETRAYPKAMLDRHEIINDSIGNVHFSVIYCPLTGTTKVWNGNINGNIYTFGVSGMVYNSNIIPFDRNTESLWGQLPDICINGALRGTRPKLIPFVETSLKTWRSMFLLPKVAADSSTGLDYSVYPYADYQTNHDNIYFPLFLDDDRLQRKEKVFGLIYRNTANVYKFTSF